MGVDFIKQATTNNENIFNGHEKYFTVPAAARQGQSQVDFTRRSPTPQKKW
jgi:hypothetical protein